MLLSNEDREKFIQWLLNEADTNDKIIVQMRKIHTPYQLIELYQEYTKACRIVANLLGHTEGDEING